MKKMNHLTRFLWFFFILIFPSTCEQCINSAYTYENYLGTKTPYRIIAKRNASEIRYDGCQATKLWALIRHGTRNPNIKLIEKMRTRLYEIKDLILENVPQATEQIHNFDLDLFRSWNSKLEDKDEKKLTHEGEDEMLFLAERMQNRFPSVLDSIYSDSAYQFKYTATQRTKKSAHYFASGLFGRNVVKSISFPEPLKQDPVLRFYKLCNKWRKEVSKNPDAIIERRKFENSDVMTKVIKEVNKRLGFTNELNFNDIHNMYTVCAFETAWNKRKKSPWCSPFSIYDFKVIEYAEDLKYYWIDGYGHELTYKQACPAFKDMIEFFQNEDSLPKATLYFTHSGTLLKMLAHMELYKESEPLTSNDFKKRANRKWRVSYIDSFGTNLAFVLFNCQGQQKILTLHQENVVHLPSCPNDDLCDIEKFLQYYDSSVQCSFNEMCDNSL